MLIAKRRRDRDLETGRLLSAEPYLCKEILEGRVTGALENLVLLPQDAQASRNQLCQLGRREEKVSNLESDGGGGEADKGVREG
jgi:hypothetical protein